MAGGLDGGGFCPCQLQGWVNVSSVFPACLNVGEVLKRMQVVVGGEGMEEVVQERTPCRGQYM